MRDSEVRRRLRAPGALLLLAVPLALGGCSLRRIAVDSLADALAQGGSSYARDEDPELVKAAIPFGLKTVESLLEESPRHRGLLLAAASGFTQYAYAFVSSEADYVEAKDLAAATELRRRALQMYLRARGYGLRGLDTSHQGLARELREDRRKALSRLARQDVALLYWTAAAWGGAISLAKADAELTADLALVGQMMERALELDEGYGAGAIHDFFVAYDGGRPAAAGGSAERARQHLEAALAVSGGSRCAPLVSFAEIVSVGAQDRGEFESLLRRALDVDVNRDPDQRLANLVAQRRARWLLGRIDELFIE